MNKRRRVIIILFIPGIFILIPVINLISAYFTNYPQKEIIKVGHRGAGGLAPENTLPAIDTGISYDVNYVEIDVRETKDGQIVVMHDKTVDRTTSGTGFVGELTYAQITQLNASKTFETFKDTVHVPLLKDVLLRIKQSDTKLLIEIKDPKLYPGLLSKINFLISETGTINDVAIFSFDKGIIRDVKKLLPVVKTGVFSICFDYTYDSVDCISPNWISILYFPLIVRMAHSHHKQVWVWTPDSAFWMKYLIKMNVDGIITNRPDILDSLLYKNDQL